MNEVQQNILEERCNIQERMLIELYDQLEYFTNMKQTNNFEHMQNKLDYASQKAKRIRSKLKRVINP